MSIKTSITLVLLMVFSAISIQAQKDRVLFTIGGEDVYTSEFSNIYKKNLSIINDESQKDIDNYLNLYVNYRLKLKQAFELKMDTVPAYIKEYNKYKDQLIEPYLNDDNKEKDLVQEAYQRMKTEIDVNHILIRLKKEATPKDTLAAYNKLMAIRKKIIEGASFEKTAREESEDPSAKQNGGNLGYFTVFQMVYPFETVAYTTQEGQISMPFRTKFGFHIIKVNDVREARGEIQVAHIMLKGDSEESKTKINSIKEQLNNGADFADLAKSYSTDLATSMKGGVLPKFTSNKMVKEFSETSFGLDKPGAISDPFKTRYGWHIVKLIKRFPIGSFEEMKPLLDKKVKRGQRAKIIGRSVIDRLLKEYTITTNQEVVEQFGLTDWNKSKNDMDQNATILTIEGKKIPAKRFSKHLDSKFGIDIKLKEAFQKFKENEVLLYFKEQLPNNNQELAQTLREYREGLLLFDLMQIKIWDQAEKDTLGFEKFFNNNRDKYQWKERVNTTIITCNKKEDAKIAKKLLKKGTAVSIIKEQLSKEGIVDIKEGAYEKENKVFPNDFSFKKGVSDVIVKNNQFMVIDVKETIDAGPKELQETRGRAISDFQDYIEKEWIKTLKKKYPVYINKKSVKKIKKKFK